MQGCYRRKFKKDLFFTKQNFDWQNMGKFFSLSFFKTVDESFAV